MPAIVAYVAPIHRKYSPPLIADHLPPHTMSSRVGKKEAVATVVTGTNSMAAANTRSMPTCSAMRLPRSRAKKGASTFCSALVRSMVGWLASWKAK